MAIVGSRFKVLYDGSTQLQLVEIGQNGPGRPFFTCTIDYFTESQKNNLKTEPFVWDTSADLLVIQYFVISPNNKVIELKVSFLDNSQHPRWNPDYILKLIKAIHYKNHGNQRGIQIVPFAVFLYNTT